MKVAIALAAVIALSGCGSTTVDSADPSTRDVRPQRVLKGPKLSPDPTRGVTPCSRLLAEGWEPAPFNDFDVSTSRTSGIAEFYIGNERLLLDIHNDVACQRLRTLGPVIARMLGDAAQLVAVPKIVGEPANVALRKVRVLGLRARVVRGVGSACLPKRTVMEQRPGGGTKVGAGGRVLIVINSHPVGRCGLDLPPVTEDLRRIADLFIGFARSSDPKHYGPPADTPIDLFIGGVLRRVIPSTRIADRDQWQACPGGVGYASRSCPISALTPFVEYPGPIATTTQKPVHPCLHATELPDYLGVYRMVTLTPDEGRDCTSYFAVQLFVNDVGQIVAVNLALSDP